MGSGPSSHAWFVYNCSRITLSTCMYPPHLGHQTMQSMRCLLNFQEQPLLRLTFPRAKLRRQIFMTRAEVWAKNWAKCSAHFRASFAVQNDPQIFSQNSSQCITPRLVAENSKFHLRELLGFGGRKPLKIEYRWGKKSPT